MIDQVLSKERSHKIKPLSCEFCGIWPHISDLRFCEECKKYFCFRCESDCVYSECCEKLCLNCHKVEKHEIKKNTVTPFSTNPQLICNYCSKNKIKIVKCRRCRCCKNFFCYRCRAECLIDCRSSYKQCLNCHIEKQGCSHSIYDGSIRNPISVIQIQELN